MTKKSRTLNIRKIKLRYIVPVVLIVPVIIDWIIEITGTGMMETCGFFSCSPTGTWLIVVGFAPAIILFRALVIFFPNFYINSNMIFLLVSASGYFLLGYLIERLFMQVRISKNTKKKETKAKI